MLITSNIINLIVRVQSYGGRLGVDAIAIGDASGSGGGGGLVSDWDMLNDALR